MTAAWIDVHGDVWHEGDDGLLHTPETAPFPREHVEKKWGPLRQLDEALDVDPLLDAIVAAEAAIAPARRRLDEAVAAARRGGMSWEAIGRTLGVSRQAAWERFRSVCP